MSSLAFGDYSRYDGPYPDYSRVDGVILNCTPQNICFRTQYDKAVNEGKFIGYYSWPLAFGPTGAIDGAQCAAFLQGLRPGPVFYDIETGSYPGDPVSLTLAFSQAIQAAGRGAGAYVQYSLINAYNWAPVVAQQVFLWFAEYTSAPDSNFGAWPYASGWQYTSTPSDLDTFYTDAAGWAALSAAPTAPPVQEDDLTPEQAQQLAYISSPQFKADIFTGASDLEKNARAAYADEFLNHQIPRQGVDPKGFAGPNTSPGAVVAWSDSNDLNIINQVNAHTDEAVKTIPAGQTTLTAADIDAIAAAVLAKIKTQYEK